MKIFVDTADMDEIREANAMGVLDGVTTNPSHISKQTGSFDEIIKEICEEVSGPVSAEVVATDWEGMVAEARHNASLAPNVVVKIPITLDGLKAIKVCSDEDIRTNVTLWFSANQAYLAAKAGATYISPFMGRLDDVGQDGTDLIHQIHKTTSSTSTAPHGRRTIPSIPTTAAAFKVCIALHASSPALSVACCAWRGWFVGT